MKKILFASLLCASFSMPFMSSLKADDLKPEEMAQAHQCLETVKSADFVSYSIGKKKDDALSYFTEGAKQTKDMSLTDLANANKALTTGLGADFLVHHSQWESAVKAADEKTKATTAGEANKDTRTLERVRSSFNRKTTGDMQKCLDATRLMKASKAVIDYRQRVEERFDVQKDNFLASVILQTVFHKEADIDRLNKIDIKQFLEAMKEAVQQYDDKKSLQKDQYKILAKVLTDLEVWGTENPKSAKALQKLLAYEVSVPDDKKRKEFAENFTALGGLVTYNPAKKPTENAPVPGLKKQNFLETLIKKGHDAHLDSQTRDNAKGSKEKPTTKCVLLKRK